MNIAFESSAIHFEKNRGIGKYIKSHIENIIKKDNENNYYIFDIYNDLEIDELFVDKNVNIIHFSLGRDGAFAFDDYSNITSNLVRRFVETYNIDIFYITHLFLPGYKRLYFDFLKNKNCNIFMFLFDIIPFVMKEHYLNSEEKYDKYINCLEQYKYADMILTDSQCAKEDLIKAFEIEKEKIEVVYAGPNPIFGKKSYSDDEIYKYKNKYNIENKFILSVSGNDYRKNIDGLINSYCLLPKEIIDKYQLVIVCNMPENSKQSYLSLVKDKKIIENKRIIFTGYIEDEDIVALNNLTDLFVFPSKYEGFGLPVLEAMKCGVPVLTSNNSSLFEIAKDAAIIVDPNSIESIKEGIILGLNKDNNKKYRDLGLERSKKYTWNLNADVSIKAFNKFKNSTYELKSDKETNVERKHIAMFTPLPPAQSGIADYSKDIIMEISKYFDIDVFIDDDYETYVNFPKNVKVLNHKEYKPHDYFKTVYQVGNSYFHNYMVDYIRKYPVGIVVLHDAILRDLPFQYSQYKQDKEVLLNILSEDYSVSDAKKVMSGELSSLDFITKNPINSFITNYASKIIVHSNFAKNILLKKDISRNVEIIPLYCGKEDDYDKAIVRQKLNIEEDTIVVSTFGNILVRKRTIPIIKAVSNLIRKGKKIKLLIVGKEVVNPNYQPTKVVEELGIQKYVVFTGFTTLDEFNDYIRATDICINLRYQYNGESSASLSRIMANGKATIVSDIGSFSEFPDDTCYKIPTPNITGEEGEIFQIESAISTMIDNPNLRESIEINAKKYAQEKLNIETVGIQYRDCILKETNDKCLNESLLSNIKNEMKLDNYNYFDALSISKTLAFASGESNTIKEKGIEICSLLEMINGTK